jgi:polysaccharide deacetylase family protein (PEP-CTERM system associated)
MTFFLTIDVEDWFQVENMKGVVSSESWNTCEVRVERNVARILYLLDSFGVKATFFVLGWIAERYPGLVKKIHGRGHEVASHGYAHKLIHHQGPDEFREDILRSKKILENIIGDKVLGYRAPSFSITDWAVEIIGEVGYKYDSSFMPASVSINKRYGTFQGISGLMETGRFTDQTNQTDQTDEINEIDQMDEIDETDEPPFRFSNGLWEFPVGVLEVAGRTIPWGGGAYFRLIPYPIFRAGLRRIQSNGTGCYVFYLHPWELDPDQPRVKGLRWDYRLRHYWGLNKTEGKLKKLLGEFEFGAIRGLVGKA